MKTTTKFRGSLMRHAVMIPALPAALKQAKKLDAGKN
jgi:hypothetical protein